MNRLWLGIVCMTTIQLHVASQGVPRFEPFQGTIYDIPGDYLNDGYGPWLSYFDVLGQVTLDSLAVPRSSTYDEYFPGVTYRTRFGIVFHSALEIAEDGCYEFYLESDDGSILWLSDSLIIDNDKPHKMTARRAAMNLEKGRYPVKVWYYSAFVSEYGLILRCKALADPAACDAISDKRQLLTFDSSMVLFEFDSDIISAEGKRALNEICKDLDSRDFRHIHIIGYADNVGSPEYNEALSERRAHSIARYMRIKLTKIGVTFKVEGRGALNTSSEYGSAEEQRQDRRVEIYIE